MSNAAPEASQFANGYRKRRRWRRLIILTAAVAVLTWNIALSQYFSNNEPGDAAVYSRIARNVISYGVFSQDEQPPTQPTIIRLPGYPLVLASIYGIFGVGNDDTVRAAQAVLLFCAAIFAGLTANLWKRGSRRKRRKTGFIAFFLAALCPFTAIYSTVLLTEAVTTFLLAAMVYVATVAIKADSYRKLLLLWIIAGVVSGVAVEIRPDAGLFAAGLGITLIVAAILQKQHLSKFISSVAAFCVAFAMVLTPWTVRNYRVFGLFQPLAPAHGEMPGEFVPLGYFRWLRTWIDDPRSIQPMLWSLEEERIDIKSVPETAFTDDNERNRVVALLSAYNNSDPEQPMDSPTPQSDDENSSDGDNDADNGADDNDTQVDDNSPDQPQTLDLKIAPDVDAEFAKLADERIARSPVNFYVVLPAKRAVSMWFDTHSEYFPFSGELFPLKDLDNETYQNIWLPIFAALVWAYTIAAALGFVLLLGDRNSAVWVVMTLSLISRRVVFFSTLENPEPRYLVELFIFTAVLGGIFLANLRSSYACGKLAISLDLKPYRRKRQTNNK